MIGPPVRSDLVASHINNRLAIGIANLFSFVAEVKIQFPVGRKYECVDAMVMLNTANTAEQHFFLVRFEIAITVDQNLDFITCRNDDPIAQHADAMCRVDVGTLVEHRLFVSRSIAIGIFEHQNPIAFFARRSISVAKMPIIQHFANPNTPQMININIRRVN